MTRSKKGIAAKLDEIGARAERDRDKTVAYVRVGRPPKPEAERGKVYSIRIPAERIEQLRRIAEANGKQPAVQARDWILQRLQEEPAPYSRARGRKVGPSTRATATPKKSASR